jgi:protein ImuB
MTGAEPRRCLVVWFPDWPVTAWRRTETNEAAEPLPLVEPAGSPPQGLDELDRGGLRPAGGSPQPRPTSAAHPAEAPVAILEAGRILACSPAARADGVAEGMRRREAQARCPELVLVPADPGRDDRVFATVLDRLELVAPGFQVVRAGLCAVPARGVARYYGGELPAAEVLLDVLVEIGLREARVGVADGLFTAEQAARLADPPDRVAIVPPGEAAAFLAPLPVTVLADEALTVLLRRLGVRTLGGFAALEPGAVLDRFGPPGARLHALSGGRDSRPLIARTPPPELIREASFEPPLELVDQVAFSVRSAADEFVAALGIHRLVCTELRVGCTDADGRISERVWLHPAAFDAAAVVDRVRWQLAGAEGLRGGITTVRLEPVAVDDAAHHEPGLFGAGVDERMHHALSRVQAMLGHQGVVTPVIAGGRWLAERQQLVPWGERVVLAASRTEPWPGSLPAPAPATVFPLRHPVAVLDATDAAVTVSERGEPSAAPVVLVEGARRRPIEAWAGPWPISERGWDAARSRTAHRFQIIDAEQTAWLLVLEQGTWWAEGRYD